MSIYIGQDKPKKKNEHKIVIIFLSVGFNISCGCPKPAVLLNIHNICFGLEIRICFYNTLHILYEPVHEFSNNVVCVTSNNVLCVTSKAADQPAHLHRLIRAFVSRLSIL